MPSLPFFKYEAAGNDFLLFEGKEHFERFHKNPSLVKKLTNRHYGVGGDGILVVFRSNKHYEMHIFNSDGYETEMCGNGLRIAGYHLLEKEQASHLLIQTKDALHTIKKENKRVLVSMKAPSHISFPTSITVDEGAFSFYSLNTGVPHAVTFVSSLASFPVGTIGRKICHHPHFMPDHTNVTFCEIDEKKKLHVRTYERGVEAETNSCGTGAIAAALVAASLHSLESPTSIHFPNDTLSVSFTKRNGEFQNVYLSGPLSLTFTGLV